MSRVHRIGAILAVLCLPLVARAQSPALTGFSGGILFPSFESNGDTVGWRFSVDRPIIVRHLGFWDGDNATLPVLTPNAVGMWDAGGCF